MGSAVKLAVKCGPRAKDSRLQERVGLGEHEGLEPSKIPRASSAGRMPWEHDELDSP